MKKYLFALYISTFLFIDFLLPDVVDASSHLTSGSNSTDLSSAGNILMALVYFMNNILLPLLFAIALLIFLINAVRFFILHGSDEDGRNKARKLMLYGIGAFVFLVSIWGIVNMFVVGLQLNNDQAFCPDYMPNNWCTSIGGTSGGSSRVNSLATYTSTGSTGGPTSGSSAVAPIISTTNVADIVFGSYADVATLDFTPGAPRAVASTPTILATQSNANALGILQLASDIENNQVAYVTFTDSSGLTQWQNITDTNNANGVGYDADTFNSIVGSSATNIKLIHTHQKSNIQAAGLDTAGYPPSTSDMEMMCDSVVNSYEHVVVDWNNVWVMNQQPGTCPRNSNQTDIFPVIESIALLSLMNVGERNQGYADLMNSNLVPNQSYSLLQTLQGTDFDSMSSAEVFGLAAPYLSQAQLSIIKTDTTSYSASLHTIQSP